MLPAGPSLRMTQAWYVYASYPSPPRYQHPPSPFDPQDDKLFLDRDLAHAEATRCQEARADQVKHALGDLRPLEYRVASVDVLVVGDKAYPLRVHAFIQ